MQKKPKPPSNSNFQTKDGMNQFSHKESKQTHFSDPKRKKEESDYHTVGGF